MADERVEEELKTIIRAILFLLDGVRAETAFWLWKIANRRRIDEAMEAMNDNDILQERHCSDLKEASKDH